MKLGYTGFLGISVATEQQKSLRRALGSVGLLCRLAGHRVKGWNDSGLYGCPVPCGAALP